MSKETEGLHFKIDAIDKENFRIRLTQESAREGVPTISMTTRLNQWISTYIMEDNDAVLKQINKQRI